MLLLALAAGVYGVFAVRDLFFLFFFYELAVLPMYLLIGVWGSSTDFAPSCGERIRGDEADHLPRGREHTHLGGDTGGLRGGVGSGHGTFSLETLGQMAANGRFSTEFQMLVFPLFMVGFGSLAGPGRSTRGLPTATWPRLLRCPCFTPEC